MQNLNTYNYELTLGNAFRTLHKRWILCVIVNFIVSIGIGLVTKSFENSYITFVLLPFIICVPAIRNRVRPMWAIGVAMRTLAADNNMRYIDSVKPNYKKHFQSALSRVGIWERNEQIVKGTYVYHSFEMYIHTFRHLFFGRYSRVATRVYRVQLSKQVPHIFIRNLQSHDTSLPRHFDDNQRVDLEGNFAQNFTVYTHRRTITEALSLLSPNVMTALIDNNKKFDIEFIGNSMYFYTSDYFVTADDLKTSFKTISTLINPIDHRLKSWKFVLPNNQYYPYLISRPGYATAKIGGKYYNGAWIFIILQTIYSFFRIWLQPEYKELKYAIVIVIDIVMIVILLFYRRKYQLLRRNTSR